MEIKDVVKEGIQIKDKITGQYYLPKIVKERYKEYTAFLIKPGVIILIPSLLIKKENNENGGAE